MLVSGDKSTNFAVPAKQFKDFFEKSSSFFLKRCGSCSLFLPVMVCSYLLGSQQVVSPPLKVRRQLLKQFSPSQELFYPLGAKLLQTLGSLFYGALAFRVALRIEFVGITHHLLF